MIYDLEKENSELIINANATHSHGMCQPLSQLADKNINAVVCIGMGSGAFRKLINAGIKAYRANVSTVEEIIKNFKCNLLEEFSSENICANHSCH